MHKLTSFDFKMTSKSSTFGRSDRTFDNRKIGNSFCRFLKSVLLHSFVQLAIGIIAKLLGFLVPESAFLLRELLRKVILTGILLTVLVSNILELKLFMWNNVGRLYESHISL